MKSFKHMRAMMALAAVMTFTCGHAQQKWTITPRVGINIANISGGTDTENLTSKVGLTAGAEAEYHFTPLLGLSAGALYSQQGCKADYTMTVRTNFMNINSKLISSTFHYLNVPVLLNLHVWQGLTLKTGLQVGYLLSAKSKTRTWGYVSNITSDYFDRLQEGVGTSLGIYVGSQAPEPTPDGLTNPVYADETASQDSKDGMHKVDVALPIGLSYEYKHFVIDARYHFGLTNIESAEPSDKSKNRYASITLGYTF